MKSRWTEAARGEFLAALGEHGLAKRACAVAGLSAAGAYHLRRRDAGFAAAWDAALERARAARAARLAAAEGARLADYRQRHDGWTPRRRALFLRALAETGCVRDACRRACISETSARRLRKRSAEFARAWDRALAKAAPTIEQAAYERAVEGWDEVVLRDGREHSRRRRYSDTLLAAMLRNAAARNAAGEPGPLASQEARDDFARKAAEMAGGAYTAREEGEAIRAQLIAKLDEMVERMAADEDACRSCGGSGIQRRPVIEHAPPGLPAPAGR